MFADELGQKLCYCLHQALAGVEVRGLTKCLGHWPLHVVNVYACVNADTEQMFQTLLWCLVGKAEDAGCGCGSGCRVRVCSWG